MNNAMKELTKLLKEMKKANEKAGKEFYESIKESLPKDSNELIHFEYKYSKTDIDKLSKDDYLYVIDNSVNYPSIIKGFNDNTDGIKLLGFNICEDPEKENCFIIDLDYKILNN